jgi:hypothetical protein
MVAASVLMIYSGRVALATIEVHWRGGLAEYRARLADGEKLGTFKTQRAARDAIDARLQEAGDMGTNA